MTNLHGLTVDTLVALELVLPNGNIIEVTKTTYPDLFFGLKVGLPLKSFPSNINNTFFRAVSITL